MPHFLVFCFIFFTYWKYYCNAILVMANVINFQPDDHVFIGDDRYICHAKEHIQPTRSVSVSGVKHTLKDAVFS